MKNPFLFSISFFLSIVCCSIASAGSPVWKVVNGDNVLFIGGTMHVLSQSDYPLPVSFEQAYQASSLLVLETDTEKMQTPAFQQKMHRQVTYSDDRSLQTVLTAPTYKQLSQHFASRGVSMARMNKLKPGMTSITLTMMELQRLGLAGTGVDEFYRLRAVRDNKRLAELETADQQLHFIATMGDGEEDALIRYTLGDIAVLPSLIQSFKQAWRSGNNQMLSDVAVKPFRKGFPKLYHNLIIKRNNAWMPKLTQMLTTQEVELVLVGALHLVGEEGVLAQLKERGYQVTAF